METERVKDICRDVLCLGGYTLEQPQAVGILGMVGMVGRVGMVGIVGIVGMVRIDRISF